MSTRGGIGRCVAPCLLAGALFLSPGCAVKSPPAPPEPVPVAAVARVEEREKPAPPVPDTPRPADSALFEQGRAAFERGDLKRAEKAFDQALARETDRAARQRTLFALAAMRLALAETEEALKAARQDYERWERQSPSGGSGEDPRFMAPAVAAMRPPAVLKEIRKNADRECSKRLLEKEEEVKKLLNQQLRELEKIHRDIQEKKKGLSHGY